MIFKRFAANLRAQNWFAIGIELAIVIVGVFIGTWVANWNAERGEKAETQRMIGQLHPQLEVMSIYYRTARRYYATTRNYAETALAGWRGDPKVSDAQFVIAAYQASQIYVIGINGSTWSNVLGAGQLPKIDDPQLRADLSYLMSADYTQVDQQGVDTPYRQNVRRMIPVGIQDQIRARCGDQRWSGNANILILPPTCTIAVSPAEAAKAAALLRAHPELRDDLQWHIAAISSFLDNIVPFELSSRRILGRSAAA